MGLTISAKFMQTVNNMFIDMLDKGLAVFIIPYDYTKWAKRALVAFKMG